MKVTFCTYDDINGMGGPNPWLRRLLPELQQRGIESRVLFMTIGPGPYPTIEAIRQMGIPYSQTVSPECTEQKIQWVLEQLAPDLPDVFVPNVIAAAYFAARWVREAGVPTVGVLHSDDTHHRGIMAEFLGAYSAFQLSGIACCSKYLEQQALAKGGPGIVTRWLPYGAPVPSQVVHPPSSTLRLIYAGRLVEEQKRISGVTQALCKAVRAVPDSEAFIYGEGEARPVVESILSSEGQDLPIFLKGWVNSDQIQQRLLESHVFVLLSDYEGLPIALMEAMACGVVPVCLRMRSGIPELVEDGITGLLVSDRGDDFVNAVRRLREEPGLWERLSKACRNKIETDYSNEVCAARWETFLHEFVKEPGTRRTFIIPKALDLPHVNPDLVHEDKRLPPLHLRVYRKMRWVAGRIKCRLPRDEGCL